MAQMMMQNSRYAQSQRYRIFGINLYFIGQMINKDNGKIQLQQQKSLIQPGVFEYGKSSQVTFENQTGISNQIGMANGQNNNYSGSMKAQQNGVQILDASSQSNNIVYSQSQKFPQNSVNQSPSKNSQMILQEHTLMQQQQINNMQKTSINQHQHLGDKDEQYHFTNMTNSNYNTDRNGNLQNNTQNTHRFQQQLTSQQTDRQQQNQYNPNLSDGQHLLQRLQTEEELAQTKRIGNNFNKNQTNILASVDGGNFYQNTAQLEQEDLKSTFVDKDTQFIHKNTRINQDQDFNQQKALMMQYEQDQLLQQQYGKLYNKNSGQKNPPQNQQQNYNKYSQNMNNGVGFIDKYGNVDNNKLQQVQANRIRKSINKRKNKIENALDDILDQAFLENIKEQQQEQNNEDIFANAQQNQFEQTQNHLYQTNGNKNQKQEGSGDILYQIKSFMTFGGNSNGNSNNLQNSNSSNVLQKSISQQQDKQQNSKNQVNVYQQKSSLIPQNTINTLQKKELLIDLEKYENVTVSDLNQSYSSINGHYQEEFKQFGGNSQRQTKNNKNGGLKSSYAYPDELYQNQNPVPLQESNGLGWGLGGVSGNKNDSVQLQKYYDNLTQQQQQLQLQHQQQYQPKFGAQNIYANNDHLLPNVGKVNSAKSQQELEEEKFNEDLQKAINLSQRNSNDYKNNTHSNGKSKENQQIYSGQKLESSQKQHEEEKRELLLQKQQKEIYVSKFDNNERNYNSSQKKQDVQQIHPPNVMIQPTESVTMYNLASMNYEGLASPPTTKQIKQVNTQESAQIQEQFQQIQIQNVNQQSSATFNNQSSMKADTQLGSNNQQSLNALNHASELMPHSSKHLILKIAQHEGGKEDDSSMLNPVEISQIGLEIKDSQHSAEKGKQQNLAGDPAADTKLSQDQENSQEQIASSDNKNAKKDIKKKGADGKEKQKNNGCCLIM
eukprot:403360407